jgi:hypothetical protein
MVWWHTTSQTGALAMLPGTGVLQHVVTIMLFYMWKIMQQL